MAIPRQAAGRGVALRPEQTRTAAITGGATTGNERLTAATGAALLVLLAVLGVTIVRIGQHVLVHLPSILPALRSDYGLAAGLSSDVTGLTGRTLAFAGALVGGLVLAVLVIPEFGPWLNASGHFHQRG